MPYDAFISYCSEDKKIADAVCGTLEANKWADFVVLDADPLADISNVRKISSVYVAGNRLPQ